MPASDRLARFAEVIFHSENGVLGMGGLPKADEGDEKLTDAGKNLTTLVTGMLCPSSRCVSDNPPRPSRCQSAWRIRSVGQ